MLLAGWAFQEAYLAELEEQRASEKRKAATRGAKRKTKRKPLRETDPWV